MSSAAVKLFVGCAKISVWAVLDAEGGHVTIEGPSPDPTSPRLLHLPPGGARPVPLTWHYQFWNEHL